VDHILNASSYSIPQLAGQRLMVGFEGTELNEYLKFLIDTLRVGGLILFSINLSQPSQIKKLCFSAQEYARSCKLPPLLIAIDQEGGEVARLKAPFTQFPGNSKMTHEKDAADFAKITARELAEMGINMNMAPVLDVAPAHIESIMGSRMFGNDPRWVSRLGVKVITGLQDKKIMAVAKHFPGIGRTTRDSHVEMPVFDAPLKDMRSFDLVPFQSAIDSDVAGVMMSHVFYKKIDPQWPASLSPKIAKDLLRDQLGYQGVVFTDDLDMGAIKKNFDMSTVIAQILSSDIDVVLICHQGPDIQHGFNEIVEYYQSNPNFNSSGRQSVQRILDLKAKYL
jgi:beta-N-acetylhexosaminidase